ncbi:MAG: hypothetical protein HYV14_03225 [Elusimicrobia bacterium]|nr:hypothetical protein [Elusimicrobiota bacterium]
MNKTEDDAAGDRGSCESCCAIFPYRLIHSGFNGSAFAYCDLCGMLALLSHSEVPRDLKKNEYGPVTDDMEGRLAPCRCGGKFRASASPRCPDCSKELSPERAAEWIERNAPGTAKGWRWQRSWQGTYALLIDEKLVCDNWQE